MELTSWQYSHLPAFLGVLGFCAVALLFERERERREETTSLRAELADARLTNLRAQMQPHFLFNTLNAAASLAARDPDATVRLLSELSDLLRRASSADEEHLTTVEEEVRFLRQYIDIMQIRFGDRVDPHVIADDGIEQLSMPVLTLQPLVENSYLHGPGASPGGGTVRVELARANDTLIIEVADTRSDAPAASASAASGMALQNLRDRLHQLYGSGAALETQAEATGFTTRITLPALRSSGGGAV